MHTRAIPVQTRPPGRFPPSAVLFLLVMAVIVGGVVTTSGGGGVELLEASSSPLGSAPQAEPAASVPWYAAPWVLIAYAIGAVGIVALLLRSRTVYLERRQEELERIVEQRTSEVEFQKRQLESYNQELLRTNEALRETVEEKSKLLGMAAHDLKNPLFGIRALSEIVLENEELSPKSERKLNLIRGSAEETLQLIDNLLATASTAAQTEPDSEPVDVAALVRWVVRSFEPHAERKAQSLHCSVKSDAPCVVEGSKRKLREAIDNLVSNALKYSSEGDDISVHVGQSSDEVTVSVEDAGPGLSESDQKRMFAPFQRLTPEPTGDEGSSGLGLYIVKQIVEMHDGRIDVDTELGRGSTFTLAFPATRHTTTPVPDVEPSEMELQD